MDNKSQILGTSKMETPKPSMTDEEIKEALKIPPRDIESYPEIPQEIQVKAGTFLYKLNLLASGADGNLQSLVWDFYDKLDNYVHLNLKSSSLDLAKAIEALKDYIQENPNIIFEDMKNNIPPDKT